MDLGEPRTEGSTCAPGAVANGPSAAPVDEGLVATFCDVAAAYLQPVQQFCAELGRGPVDSERVEPLLAPLATVLAAAQGMGLEVVSDRVAALSKALEESVKNGAESVEGTRRVAVLRDTAALAAVLPSLAGACTADDSLDGIMLRTLLQQVSGLRAEAQDRLYSAGFSTVPMLAAAAPAEVAAVTGLPEALCRDTVAHAAAYWAGRQQRLAYSSATQWLPVLEAALAEANRQQQLLEASRDGEDVVRRRARRERQRAVHQMELLLAEMGRCELVGELQGQRVERRLVALREMVRVLQRLVREERTVPAAPSAGCRETPAGAGRVSVAPKAAVAGAPAARRRLIWAVPLAGLVLVWVLGVWWTGWRDRPLQGNGQREVAAVPSTVPPPVATVAPQPAMAPPQAGGGEGGEPASEAPAEVRVPAAASVASTPPAKEPVVATDSPPPPPAPMHSAGEKPPARPSRSKSAAPATAQAADPPPTPVLPAKAAPPKTTPESAAARAQPPPKPVKPAEPRPVRRAKAEPPQAAPESAAVRAQPLPEPVVPAEPTPVASVPAVVTPPPVESPTAVPVPVQVAFADATLEACVRSAVAQPAGPLDPEQLAGVSTLTCSATGGGQAAVTRLEGIEFLPGLQTLDLAFQQISDIQPLAALQQLRTLNLRGNRIADIGPVAKLPRDCEIDLWQNPIVDITPLLLRSKR